MANLSRVQRLRGLDDPQVQRSVENLANAVDPCVDFINQRAMYCLFNSIIPTASVATSTAYAQLGSLTPKICVPFSGSIAAITAKAAGGNISVGTASFVAQILSTNQFVPAAVNGVQQGVTVTVSGNASSPPFDPLLVFKPGQYNFVAGDMISIWYYTSASYTGPSAGNGFTVGVWVYQ